MQDQPQLSYPNKKDEAAILAGTPQATLDSAIPIDSNILVAGENLSVMQSLLHRGFRKAIDLVYIDPPFATSSQFNIGHDRANTVSKIRNDEIAYKDIMEGTEYFEFLRERLIFLRELMSVRGSIYVHIDSRNGHYLKILMDEIFGRENFRNDIGRIKCNPKNFLRKAFGNTKDMILFYSFPGAIWNEPRVPLTESEIQRLFRKKDTQGRRYTTIPLHAPGETLNGPTGGLWRGMAPPRGRHWRSSPQTLEELDRSGQIEWSSTGVPRKKIYADEKQGKRMQDIWTFKDPQYPSYPTEKKIDLLKLIIQASSDPSSMVLDCFCGSGTTLVAAQELGRRWIGIDRSDAAVRVAKQRLAGVPYGFLVASKS